MYVYRDIEYHHVFMKINASPSEPNFISNPWVYPIYPVLEIGLINIARCIMYLLMALKYENFTTMHSKTDQVVTVVLDHASLALRTDKNVAV